jgi:hypothetical protein
LLGVLTSPVAGCLVLGCTEIGCAGGVELTASASGATDASATLRVLDDGTLTAEFECTSVGEVCTPTGSDDGGLSVERTAADEFSISVYDGGGETIRVEVDVDGQTYGGEVSPDWEESTPNGPGCPPVCRQAPAEDVALTAS